MSSGQFTPPNSWNHYDFQLGILGFMYVAKNIVLQNKDIRKSSLFVYISVL